MAVGIAACLSFGARAVPGVAPAASSFGVQHAVGDEVDVGAVFACSGTRADHVGAFAEVGARVDGQVLEVAFGAFGALRRLRTRTGRPGLLRLLRSGAASTRAVSGNVSVKNTREPSMLAVRKCTSSSAASSAVGSLTPCAALSTIVLPGARVTHVQTRDFGFLFFGDRAPEHARAVGGDRVPARSSLRG